MKSLKIIKTLTAVLFAVVFMTGAARAETLTLDGTVEAGVTVPVYAPIGGTIDHVFIEAGMRVAEGEVLFDYRTEKIYASMDGTVTGVFAQAGDDAAAVAEQYGADLYIEGAALYTVSASTSKAYSSVETKFVHTGESVYLVCPSDTSRKGTGIVGAIDGTDYTVLVTDGSFIVGDTVSVYREASYTDRSRVGRGTVARVNPTAVTGEGAVVSVAVKDGDAIKRGDLLMETLTGTFDAYEATGTSVPAAENGVITEVLTEAGSTVAKGDVIAKVALSSGMRVEALIAADDRLLLKAGDSVTVALEADESKSYQGTVRYISEIPEEDTTPTAYKAIIDFAPDENIYFGMAVTVTAGE